MLNTEIQYLPGASVDKEQHAYWQDGSLLVRAKNIPWTPWALPGTQFKLLDFDKNHSYSCILLHISADAPATIHKHIGAANAYILQGGFSYEHGAIFEGDFMCEAGGVTHMPYVFKEGCTLLGFNHGAVAGIGEQGEITGIIDVDWLIEQAKANNAFAHLAHKE
ncbi:cupin domain-containing protein [Acinetobacter rudis]|uniref:Cupin domain-containing protein n=1 Tax=Acinetobacter rudis TaxID=632955 RepID=A0AAW8J622_9GAMM|nr:cupin domain-containing protein [Acinetobacter rudis]MDQ8934604.1 cupin domain-containing protein [Acinetobacter rudis]MDQ9016826.1 cupin domain-containing protein [Acinetobacter rudis]